ncbi:MAG: ISL3 family transposase, partial [Pseudomonadota bacterium]
MDRKIIYPIKGLHISSLSMNQTEIAVSAILKQSWGRCPDCSVISKITYGWHHRHLDDLPCSGRSVRMDLKVRRWACHNPNCERRTFIEPIPDLFERHGRRTTRLQGLVTYIGRISGGLPGQRILDQIGVRVSDDTLIRALKKQAAQCMHDMSATVIGIDEWGQSYKAKYGTIIIDLETRSVIDVLSSRDTDVVRNWFRTHPNVKLVNRDRCSGFARAAREGAPEAAQIADRFHILDNFKSNIELQLGLRSHKTKLAMLELTPHEKWLADETSAGSSKKSTAAQHHARIKMAKIQSREALYNRARQMSDDGFRVADIAEELGFKPKTSDRWFRNGGTWRRRERP